MGQKHFIEFLLIQLTTSVLAHFESVVQVSCCHTAVIAPVKLYSFCVNHREGDGIDPSTVYGTIRSLT